MNALLSRLAPEVACIRGVGERSCAEAEEPTCALTRSWCPGLAQLYSAAVRSEEVSRARLDYSCASLLRLARRGAGHTVARLGALFDFSRQQGQLDKQAGNRARRACGRRARDQVPAECPSSAGMGSPPIPDRSPTKAAASTESSSAHRPVGFGNDPPRPHPGIRPAVAPASVPFSPPKRRTGGSIKGKERAVSVTGEANSARTEDDDDDREPLGDPAFPPQTRPTYRHILGTGNGGAA